MPETLQQGSILLVRGLDKSNPAEYISEQSASNVQNYYVNKGLLSKRLGTVSRGTAIGGIDKEIMAGREFTREGVLYNVRIGVDNIENFNSGTDTWDDITGTTLTGDSSDLIDTAIPLLAGKEILCITNGIDVIRKWTGTGSVASLGGTPPVAKFIQEYKSYLICAHILGGTDVAQRVQWSDSAKPETWDSGNAGAVDLIEDGEPITGLNIFGTFLCVHKKTCIYVGTLVSSTKIFQFDRRVTQAGTVANGSIVNLPSGQQIFLAEDGLRIFNGVTAPLIPSPINDEIRDGLNKEYAFKAWAQLVLEKDEVWIGVPLGSQTNGETVYKYNYVTQSVHKDVRTGINTVWRASQSSGIAIDNMTGTYDEQTASFNDGQLGSLSGLFHFGNTSGITTIQQTGAVDDNGVAIDAIWDSKDFKGERLGQLLRFQEIWVWAKGSGTLNVLYSLDEGETWTDAGDITLSTSFPNQLSPDKLYIDEIGQQIRLRFQHNSSTGNAQIKQFIVGYIPREDMV